MPERWNDDRLDELRDRVDIGFAETKAEIRALRGEIAADRRAVVQAAAAVWVTSMIGFLGVIVTIVARA